MKKLCILFFAFFSASITLNAQDVWVFTVGTTESNFSKEAIAPKVTTPPTLDGIPETLWDQATWNRAQYWTLETGAPNNPTMTQLPTDTTDHYMEWKAVWDDSTVYFLVHVVDDVTTYSSTRSAWWRQDGIEFYVYQKGVPTAALNRNDTTSITWFNIYPNPTANIVDPQIQSDYGATGSVLINGTNVFYEFKDVNWTNPESRGSIPANNDTIMVAMMANESDNTDPAIDNRDMKITWAIQGEARNGLGPDMGYVILTDPNALSIDTKLDLLQSDNFPNPFSTTTTIRYQLEQASPVSVKVMDLQGRTISEVTSEVQPAGSHAVTFNGADQPTGVYFFQIQAGDQMARGRMIISR
ncbi:MAG: T9SS type A sorting domain-containing protein [Bacteroidia bacterium]|nr:T9SS type A sorting domain-containing protein [Bacteroidia bacterium]